MKYKVQFYCKENGDVPVKEFLLSLNSKMRAKAFSDIARIFYFSIHNNRFVLISGFIKKQIKRRNENWKELEDIVRILKEGA